MDLVEKLTDDHGLTKGKAKSVLDTVFSMIEQTLLDGEEVKLGRVGRLSVERREARTVNGFGEKREIPAQRFVRFKAFQRMKRNLNAA